MKVVTVPMPEYLRLMEADKVLKNMFNSLGEFVNQGEGGAVASPTQPVKRKDVRDMSQKERNAHIKNLDFSSKRKSS